MGGIEKVEGLTIIPDENPGLEVTIGGVFEDLPQNASLRYDMLVAMSGMDPESLNNWLGNDRYAGYVRLSPGVTPDSLTPAIHDMTLRHHDQEALRKSGYELTYTLRPLLDLQQSGRGKKHGYDVGDSGLCPFVHGYHELYSHYHFFDRQPDERSSRA